MRRLILATAACLLLVGCDHTVTVDFGNMTLPHVVDPQRPNIQYPAYESEYPTVNIDGALRQENWLGDEDEGSCVHATMIMLLRWQGRDDLADYWRGRYENGEWPEGLADKFDTEGVRYAYTSQGKDVSFLEWACRTRRGCGVTVQEGRHMVMLVHLDAERAGIIDNNRPGEIQWRSRESFLNEWFNSRSWAVTPVYTPPPPLPCEETR